MLRNHSTLIKEHLKEIFKSSKSHDIHAHDDCLTTAASKPYDYKTKTKKKKHTIYTQIIKC